MLAERGHRVGYFAPSWAAEMVSRVRCEHRVYASYILQAPPGRVNGFRGEGMPALVAREIRTAIGELLEQLAKFGPDAVIYDGFTYAGKLAGERLGVPLIQSETSYLLTQETNFYRETEAGRLRGRLMSSASLAEFDSLMGPVFQELGLPARGFLDLVESPAKRRIVFVARAFHPHAEEYDSGTVFVGPSLSEEVRPAKGTGAFPERTGRKFVYVSFGSVISFQPAFYHAIAEASRELDVDLVLSVGERFAALPWCDRPSNVTLFPVVRQINALRRVDAFVGHGGMGGTMESLALGVPMLVVPHSPEQLFTGRRVAELGLGRCLDPDDASILRIRKELTELLSEPAYRQRAQAFAPDIAVGGSLSNACDLVEGVTRGPRV